MDGLKFTVFYSASETWFSTEEWKLTNFKVFKIHKIHWFIPIYLFIILLSFNLAYFFEIKKNILEFNGGIWSVCYSELYGKQKKKKENIMV